MSVINLTEARIRNLEFGSGIWRDEQVKVTEAPRQPLILLHCRRHDDGDCERGGGGACG